LCERQVQALRPLIVAAAEAIACASFLIDGEAICCGPDGIADFELLHSRRHDRETILVAFDLVELDGRDLRDEPIEAREAQLAKLLGARRRHEPVHTALQLCEHLEGDGAQAFAAACQSGARRRRFEALRIGVSFGQFNVVDQGP
jgi:ATP-dependent DNA ligase